MHHDTDHPATPEEDDTVNPTEAAPGGEAASASAMGGQARERLEPYVTQLQQMIASLSTQAEPKLREIAAKAAELAAVAAERAGPIAQKAAETTASIGERMATRGKEVAADLRRSAGSAGTAGTGGAPADPTATDGMGGATIGDADMGWGGTPDMAPGSDDPERNTTPEQTPGL